MTKDSTDFPTGTGPLPQTVSELPPALAGVTLMLSIRIGTAKMTVRDLAALGEGSLVELEARADAPLEVCLEDPVVARGELCEGEDGGLAIKLTETVA